MSMSTIFQKELDEIGEFAANSLTDILKVKNCTYTNGIQEPRIFYTCSCSGGEFKPICESCAKICHSSHYPLVSREKDNFICSCGNTSHQIQNVVETEQISNTCFYNKFHNITEHSGYYLIENEGKVVCSSCLEYCNQKKITDKNIKPYLIYDKDSIDVCKCEDHKNQSNINYLNDDLAKFYLYNHYKNFNINILNNFDIAKKNYFTFILKKIENLRNHGPDDDVKCIKFFTNFYVIKIFKNFSNFVPTKNSSAVLSKKVFPKKYKDTLFELLRRKENISQCPQRDIESYCYSKIYYAELFFNYFIDSTVKNYFPRINLDSYCNLNLYQKFLYLHNARNFCANYLSNREKYYEFKYLDNYGPILLDLYEILLKYDDVYKISNFKNIVFFKFNKIFKNLIKYNLIKDEARLKYFELVYETLQFKRVTIESNGDSKISNFEESTFYIVKSIFFSFNYINDLLILTEFTGTKYLNLNIFENENQSTFSFDKKNNFIFDTNKYSDLMSLIFLIVLNDFRRDTLSKDTNKFRKILKYDLYVKKIFEMMICCNDEVYSIKSIKNLKNMPHQELKLLFDNYSANSQNNFKFNQSIEKFLISNLSRQEALSAFNKMNENLNKLCNQYFQYEIMYDEFLLKSDSVLKDVSNFIKGYLMKLPPIEKNFHYYVMDDLGDANNKRRIKYIQDATKYTNFYTVLNKLLFIYGEDKKFNINLIDQKLRSDDLKLNNIEILINIIMMSIYDNYENLTLLMSVSPMHFVLSFIQTPIGLFNLLTNIMEMLFGEYGDYKIDNYHFYYKLISFLCKITKVDDKEQNLESISQNFEFMGKILSLVVKPIRSISIFQTDLIGIIECIKDKMIFFNFNSFYYKYLVEYIFSNFTNKNYPSELSSNISLFLINYFDFINQIMISDLYFLELFDEKYFLFDIEMLHKIIKESKVDNQSLKEIIIRNIINYTFNFSFTNSDKHTENLIKLIYTTYSSNENSKKSVSDERNFSLIHLTDFSIAKEKNIEEKYTKYFNYVSKNLNINNYTLLNKIMTDFLNENIVLSTDDSIEYFQKINRVFRYYESLILNPMHILINHYLLLEDELRGQDSHKIYELVLNFLNVTVKFYSLDIFNNFSQNMNLHEKLYHSNGFTIKVKLKIQVIDSIKHDINEISNKVKYFELDKIIKIYRKNLKNIELNEEDINEILLSFQDNQLHLENKKFDEKINEQIKNTCTVYTRSFRNSFGKKNSLINTLHITNIENINLTSQIYNYLEKKACDNLNYNNYSGKESYQYSTFSNLSEKKELIVENFYVFEILNYFFYNDLDKFQEFINIKMKETDNNFKNIFLNLIKYVIFDGLINECSKMYQMNSIFSNHGKKKVSISYEMIIIAVELIFKVCENQNKLFHEFLFNLKIFEDSESVKEIMDPFQKLSNNLLVTKLHSRPNFIKFSFNISNTIESTCETLKVIIDNKSSIKNIPEDYKKYFYENEKNTSNKNSNKFLQKFSQMLVGQRKDRAKFEIDGYVRNQKYQYINFLFLQLILILKQLPLDERRLLYRNRDFNNYNKLLNIYNCQFSVLVQLIQGSGNAFFELFYKKIPTLKLDEKFNENSEIYYFIKFASDVRDLLYNENILDFSTLSIKISIFVILNNLISQELTDNSSLIALCTNLFTIEDLLEVSSRYLRALYVKYILIIEYDSEEFVENYLNLEFNKTCFPNLLNIFENNLEFYNDDFFKLSSQIFLFITILSEKYYLIKAKDVLDLANFPIKEVSEKESNKNKNYKPSKTKVFDKSNSMKPKSKENQSNAFNNNEFSKFNRKFPEFKYLNLNISVEKLMICSEKMKNVRKVTDLNSLIVTAKFFKELIKTCEILIEDNKNYSFTKNKFQDANIQSEEQHNERSIKKNSSKLSHQNKIPSSRQVTSSLKIIYFIIDPRTLLVSKKNYDIFYENVDRSRITSKLIGLVHHLEIFQIEIDYKLNNLKNNKKYIWIYEKINTNFIDKLNFIISCLINVTLLLSLSGEDFQAKDLSSIHIIYLMGLLQMIINLIYMWLFFKTKYNYYTILNFHNVKNKSLSLIQKMYIYCIENFISNDDSFIPTINIIITLISLMSINLTFIYTLQLFAIVKFVPTMKEIVTAFHLRFTQIITMIWFLAILINFYAILGFFFMIGEFNLTLGDGHTENVCQNLLSCYMIFFNYGIRSGGGIGDLLGVKTMNEGSIYWMRYFSDFIFYITVILIILNMINGIIISTFSYIRDENDKKDEDMNERCFICSINKVEFEKQKVDFSYHTNNDHNFITYIKYLIGLRLNNVPDNGADETYILKCLNNKNIKFFPIRKTTSLNYKLIDDETYEDDDE